MTLTIKNCSETNWKDTLNYTNPNDATNYLVDQITNITKKSEIPLAINSFRKKKLWITNAIVTSIKKRQLIKNPFPGKEKKYKEYRNNLNIVNIVAKNGYYENKINEFNRHEKIIW